MQDIENRIGVFKVPYTSSVGARRPTHADDDWSRRVREEAHEYGTTTGGCGIFHPDLPLLSYNIRLSGVEVLAALTWIFPGGYAYKNLYAL
jgi:adenylosuccinate synthase